SVAYPRDQASLPCSVSRLALVLPAGGQNADLLVDTVTGGPGSLSAPAGRAQALLPAPIQGSWARIAAVVPGVLSWTGPGAGHRRIPAAATVLPPPAPVAASATYTSTSPSWTAFRLHLRPSAGGTVIAWHTNNAANSGVDYGTTTAYGSNVSDGTQVTNHSLT